MAVGLVEAVTMTVPTWWAPGMLNVALKNTIGQSENWMSTTKIFVLSMKTVSIKDLIPKMSTSFLLSFSCLA